MRVEFRRNLRCCPSDLRLDDDPCEGCADDERDGTDGERDMSPLTTGGKPQGVTIETAHETHVDGNELPHVCAAGGG